jgi:hypothetical protein
VRLSATSEHFKLTILLRGRFHNAMADLKAKGSVTEHLKAAHQQSGPRITNRGRSHR